MYVSNKSVNAQACVGRGMCVGGGGEGGRQIQIQGEHPPYYIIIGKANFQGGGAI